MARAKNVQVIAEIASAHCGNRYRLTELITVAEACGADGVKFQVYGVDHLAARGTEPYAVFKDLAFPKEVWREAFELCNSLKLPFWVEIYDREYLDFVEPFAPYGYKVHTTNINEFDLLRHIGGTGRPVILSTCCLSAGDIDRRLAQMASAAKDQFLLSTGHQSYPTRLTDLNLARVGFLRETFGLPIVFSDHVAAESEWSLDVPLLAAAAGAAYIEKHLVMARPRKDNDFHSALEPSEFRAMVAKLGALDEVFGTPSLAPQEEETQYYANVQRKCIALESISAGESLYGKNIGRYRVPGEDVLAASESSLIKAVAARDIGAAEPVALDAVQSLKVGACIIVRMKSSRLCKKATARINEQFSVVEFLIERLKQSVLPDHIILCTSTVEEDDVLEEIACKTGVECVRADPDNVFSRLERAIDDFGLDVVVRITGDNPMTDPFYLDEMIKDHIAQGAEYTYNEDLPLGTKAEVMSAEAIKRAHRQASDPNLSEYMTFFFRGGGSFRSVKYEGGFDETLADKIRLTVDFPEDLQVVSEVVSHLHEKNPRFSVEDIYEYHAANPELFRLNQSLDNPFDKSIKTKCFLVDEE